MKIKKIISRLERKAIFLLDGLNTKQYMRHYNAWLINEGMDIRGNAKYIHHSVVLDGVSYQSIHIGNNVVISLGCVVLVHDFSIEAGLIAIGYEHTENSEAYFMKEVFIGDNCFIGANTTILGGTKIGNNCIVGAGSVLPGSSYPDNSVIVGNPGKIICKTTSWANNKLEKSKIYRGYFN